ncbi:hypothetical protein [Hydrogenophaga sp.]|uniref:hypothetical protein n=1 Tax=Hydrogenophaga sp. TaxID=1904254 RepID=UPI002AB839C8|nr:hypothetical protein [Hydrogenophaga sp.]MDZ4398453.1 hypothetical protein [Hydrogenophaga sp.]
MLTRQVDVGQTRHHEPSHQAKPVICCNRCKRSTGCANEASDISVLPNATSQCGASSGTISPTHVENFLSFNADDEVLLFSHARKGDVHAWNGERERAETTHFGIGLSVENFDRCRRPTGLCARGRDFTETIGRERWAHQYMEKRQS